MAKLTHILGDSELKTLENLRQELFINDLKIAGKLYAKLKKHCNRRGVQMKLTKGRINKVLVNVNGNKVMAKPIILNNQLQFFYKKEYFSTEECLNINICI